MDFTYKSKKHSNTHITYNVTVDYKEYDKIKEEVYDELAKDIELKGFRKGQAPRNMVEPMILKDLINKSLERLLSKITSEMLEKEGVDPASTAKYDVKEVDKTKGISFEVEFYVYTKFSLPDIKKIKIKISQPKVTADEVKAAIENTREEWNKSKTKGKITKVTDKWIKELKLPKVETISDFEKFVEAELLHQKYHIEEQRIFNEILDKEVAKSKIEIPENVIENIKKGEHQRLDEELKKLKLTKEKYLKSNKKTEAELESEWVEKYSKSISTEIFLSRYGRINDVKVPQELLEALKKQYEGSPLLYRAVEKAFLDLSANHFWQEIKKINKIEHTH
ncbi:hypothetical protein JW962_00545 [Candidatus Dojkabacteria bacterium]|nr:hypothetical protein [Candidatus Dojkabacteria bacterium]